MLVDEKDFFREATLKICSSLEMETALEQTGRYLSKFFPLDGLGLMIFHIDLGIVEGVAGVMFKSGFPIKGKTSLPEKARKALEKAYLAPNSFPRVKIVNQISEDYLTSTISEHLGTPNGSSLQMFLELEGKILGVLALISLKGEKFSEEQSRLLSLLNEPFAIALSNFLRYRQLVELKEDLADDNQYLQEELRKETGSDIIGSDFGLKGVMELVRHVSVLKSPVLLLGETGTGKEVIANAIHDLSGRSRMPFIKFNCGSIPATLLDSELFGHEKGAFTGAISKKRGRFERANHGTIFLDEIGELPTEAQVRLLRVLQEKEIDRIGGTETIKLDIRIIAATHRDLDEMIKQNLFREDLFFRLKVFPIVIPPLRDRLLDMPALVHHFLQKKTREMGLEKIPTLIPGAMERLKNYHWPGNVRELENVIERAIIMNKGGQLSFHEVVATHTPSTAKYEAYSDKASLIKLNDVISNHIKRVVGTTNGKINGPDGAAHILDINPSTLRQKMRKLGIPFGRKAKYMVRSIPPDIVKGN